MAPGEPIDRDVLLTRVEARVERYAESKNSAEVLGDAAAAEAEALLAAAGWDVAEGGDELDVEALAAVAWLFWCRGHCADTPDDEADLGVAVPLFADLHSVVPQLLPPSLRAQLDEANMVSPGTLAYRQWQQTGDPAALDDAIDVMRTEVANGTNVPRRLSNLAGVLRERFLRTGDVSDLDEAVAAAAESVAGTDPAEGELAVRLSNQGSVLLARFDHSGALADLDASVHALRAATSVAADGVFRSNLAAALISRYMHRGDPADLAEAVAASGEAVRDPDLTDGTRADAAAVHCLTLTRRHEATGDPAPLAAAVEAGQEAVRLAGADGAEAMSGLAAALVARHLLTGSVEDLDAAAGLGRRAVAASGPADRATHLSNLSDTLLLSAGAGSGTSSAERGPAVVRDPGTTTVLDEAVALAQEAVGAAGPACPGRVTYLTNLGAALLSRHELTERPDDLSAAISACRSAVAASQPSHRDRPRAVSTLGLALLARYESGGTPEDLDEAVRCTRLASTADADVDDRISHLGNHSATLHQLFVRTGEAALLDEAVTAARQAVRLAAGTAQAPVTLSNLSAACSLRYETGSTRTDLDDAVDAARRAVATTRPGDHALAVRHSNLGAALQMRFEQAGALTDLDEAISAARTAVARSSGPMMLAASRSGLAAALYRRFVALHDRADLNEAVAAARSAVEGTPDRAPEQAGRRANLAGTLMVRAELTHLPEDLDDAVGQYRQAVLTTPHGSTMRAAMLSNLGHALAQRFATTGAAGDLSEAIAACRDAVALMGEQPLPDRATYLINLAHTLTQDARRTGDVVVRDEALRLLADAAADRASPVPDRLTAAWWRGRIGAEAGLAGQARAGFADAVRLLPQATWSGLDRRSQEWQLGRLAEVAADAAAWQLDDARASDAVELLELGRSVLWSRTLDERPDLTRLVDADRVLAHRLVEVGTRRALL